MRHDGLEERFHLATDSRSNMSDGDERYGAFIVLLELSEQMCHSFVQEMLRKRLRIINSQSRYESDDHLADDRLSMRLEG